MENSAKPKFFVNEFGERVYPTPREEMMSHAQFMKECNGKFKQVPYETYESFKESGEEFESMVIDLVTYMWYDEENKCFIYDCAVIDEKDDKIFYTANLEIYNQIQTNKNISDAVSDEVLHELGFIKLSCDRNCVLYDDERKNVEKMVRDLNKIAPKYVDEYFLENDLWKNTPPLQWVFAYSIMSEEKRFYMIKNIWKKNIQPLKQLLVRIEELRDPARIYFQSLGRIFSCCSKGIEFVSE